MTDRMINSTLRLELLVTNSGGGVTAAQGASATVAVRRASSGDWLDFNDNTFKSSAWTTRQQTLSEVDATNAPGYFGANLNLNNITLVEGEELVLEYEGDISGTKQHASDVIRVNHVQEDVKHARLAATGRQEIDLVPNPPDLVTYDRDGTTALTRNAMRDKDNNDMADPASGNPARRAASSI